MPENSRPSANGHGRLRVVLAAEESAGAHTLRGLFKTDHDVVGLLTSDPAGAVGKLADSGRVPGWPARAVKDPALAEKLRDERVDLLLNVHSLYIVKPEILEAPRLGAFNMHPGPLPEYAGLNCVSWAIYNGESTYAVTIHEMAPRLDAGDIIYREEFPISDSDTPVSLASKSVRAGVPKLMELVDTMAADPAKLPRRAQDLSRRRYYGKKPPNDGRVEWNSSAFQIVNFVRACDYFHFDSPWGRPETSCKGRDYGVLKAAATGRRCDAQPGEVGPQGAAGVLVATADEWVNVSSLSLDGDAIPAAEALHTGDRLA